MTLIFLSLGDVGMAVADLFIVIFNAALADPKTAHGREGFYFGENGEHVLSDISKAIGKAMVRLGKAKTAEPTTFTEDEVIKYFGVCRDVFLCRSIFLIVCYFV